MQKGQQERGVIFPGPGSSSPVYPGKQLLKDSPKYPFAGKLRFEDRKYRLKADTLAQMSSKSDETRCLVLISIFNETL